MTAVAVWDRVPTAMDLLDDRLVRGWRPMPSPVADGPTILGVAAGWEARLEAVRGAGAASAGAQAWAADQAASAASCAARSALENSS